MELIALGQACGTAMLSLAIIAYGIPKWTTDEQLNEAAKFFGIVAILFTLMQLYKIIISKSSPGIVMDWISVVVTALLGVGFFMKSNSKAA